MSHPLLKAEEYKARYLMLASGEPTERLERVVKAAKSLADSAREMACTSQYPLHECIALIDDALHVSLKRTAEFSIREPEGDGGAMRPNLCEKHNRRYRSTCPYCASSRDAEPEVDGGRVSDEVLRQNMQHHMG